MSERYRLLFLLLSSSLLPALAGCPTTTPVEIDAATADACACSDGAADIAAMPDAADIDAAPAADIATMPDAAAPIDLTADATQLDAMTIPTCNDGVKNGAESDIDCGGACVKCADGRNCVKADDCQSLNCNGGKCLAALSCANGIKDGAETDVDCGGSCTKKCSFGKGCKVATDCISTKCEAGQCGSIIMAIGWNDTSTTSCSGTISTRMGVIRDAMPVGAFTVRITAQQSAPKLGAAYGMWAATFPTTDCVRKWLSAFANRDIVTYNHWNPGVCQASDDTGVPYRFVLLDDGMANPLAAIQPVGANPGQYLKLYLLDRTAPPCDLAGVNNAPGADIGVTNASTFGRAGDSVTFAW